MKSLALVTFFLATASFSAHAEQRVVECSPQKAQQTLTVNAEARDQILVVASGNPTTGYEWISNDGIKGKFAAGNSGMIGSGGVYTFRIEAKEGSRQTYTFEYKRRWMTEAASVCKVNVNVR